MIIKASEDQIKQMVANAVNASIGVGLGLLHLDSAKVFKPHDFEMDPHGIYLDYVQGRMVKLMFTRAGEDWRTMDFPPRGDYQSWADKYPDYSLIESVGAEVVSDD